LLFENEYTRVWEMLLEPGEAFPIHAHEYPYLSLITEAAALILSEEDGTERRLQPEAGQVIWGDIPDVHAIRNVGATRFRNRLVEFKTA
jgi:quercetin dioxygenase-like cupin family protein